MITHVGNPVAIVDDILGSAPVAHDPAQLSEQCRSIVRHDRAQAIMLALQLAHLDDVIVVAGKGHEQQQIIEDELRPWCDVSAVAACARELGCDVLAGVVDD